MRRPPIPQRIPPLTWRQPAFLWTPLALALAIGWPAALFYDDLGPQRVAVAALLVIFALALVSLGVSWALGRAPRARRVVVLHVVIAGFVVALAAPFVLTAALATVTGGAQSDAAAHVTLAMSLASTPLVLILGLPVILVSGIVFAWTALQAGAVRDERESYRHQVQPFR